MRSRLRRAAGLAAFLAAILGAALVAPRTATAKMTADEWTKAQADYKRLFSSPGSEIDKEALIKALVADDDPRSWKLLLDAVVREAELWVKAQEEVNEKVGKMNELLQKGLKGWTPDDEAVLHQIQNVLPGLESAVKVERGVLQTVIDAVAAGPEVLRKSILARGKTDPAWAIRAAAARVAAKTPADPESQAYLHRALDQDKDPRVRMAALETLASAEADWEPYVLGRLGDVDWGVQLLAVRIVLDRKLQRAVPHLINALERARPRMQQEIGNTLKALTGAQIEPYADAWAKWWADHKEEFEAGGEVKTGGKPKEQFPDVKVYGLPIKSDRLVFVIDVSDSMKLETKNEPAPGTAPSNKPPPGPTTPGEAPPPKPPPPPPEPTLSGRKIDVAKDELRKAIKKLPKDAKFNVIAFNHAVTSWATELKPATDENKAEATKWFAGLEPSGSTYVDGALRMAFQLAGAGAVDPKFKEAAVDTIVLLADGAPTDNGFPVSNLMDPEVILQHVREWNAQKRVVVHTICVDMIDGVEFMRKLAEENGGTIVNR